MGRGSFDGFVAVALFGAMVCSSEAYQFYVGGKDGWVLNPSESFNHWAERNRFQVNDTLYFEYKDERDSVLVVSKEDYFSCNTKNPITRLSMKDGEQPVYKFGHSGPFYFISGNADGCQNGGQKLIVVVLAVRHKQEQEQQHHHQSQPPCSSSPVVPPPQAQIPPAESPEKSDSPVPAPAHKNSAFGGPVVTFSFGVGMVFAVLLSGFFVGLF